ncbi:CYTH domain-containing protein [Taibaiella lutea]|uniref:CYTH domain-containing protein n=1 Tax=Taibaiella lutea TaxID=2608001 RepID=A0A5M6CEU6_9BACT|nr:CYTH domain-containing protein [Taibaiella lutea]KAA5533694.1 CYTH domain-containing protein [Taibaiella lutea]
MAIEIERKFLINKEKWNALPKPESKFIRQGYITTDAEKTIRVRITGNEAYLTIKGKTTGFSRTEIECTIPATTATEMLQQFAITEIIKERYRLPYQQHIWEVDVFHGKNEGLIVAEIELENESVIFEKPDWVAEEVTDDSRYYNSNLSLNPFLNW